MPENTNDAVTQTVWDQDLPNTCEKASDLPFKLIPQSYCNLDFKSSQMKIATADASNCCKLVPNTYKVMPSAKPIAFHLKNVPVDATKLKCRWCDFTCTDGYSLNTHVLKHVKSKPFYCLYCSFRAPSLSQLSHHITEHAAPSKLDNPVIVPGVPFDVSPNENRHEPTVQPSNSQEPLACSLCGFKASEISKMIPHIKTHSLESCDISDSDDRAVNHAFDKPSAGKTVSCTLCDFSSPILSTLLNHVLGHTKIKDKTDDDVAMYDVGVDRIIFSCTECEYRCVRPNKLTEHMRIHGPDVVFRCSFCDFTSTNVGDMKVHKKNHGADKPFACEMCDARFTRLDNLKTHALVHSNEKPFACEKCDYRCPTKCRLKAHVKMHEKDDKRNPSTLSSAKCLLCGAQFSTIRTLHSHLRGHVTTHMAENPPVKSNLSQEDRAEHRKKLYQLIKNQAVLTCPHCSFQANREYVLASHIRTHTGERPFKCDTCQSTFTIKTHLIRHQRVHTGEKPFPCPLCGARFSQSGNRKSHLEKVHGMKLEKRPSSQRPPIRLRPPENDAQNPVILLVENEDVHADIEKLSGSSVEEAEDIEGEFQEIPLVKIEIGNDEEMTEEEETEDSPRSKYGIIVDHNSVNNATDYS